MMEKMQSLFVNVGRFDRRYIQLLIVLLTLILFVLAGGAPEHGSICSSC